MKTDRRPPVDRFSDRTDRYRNMGRRPMAVLRGQPIDLNWAGWRSNTHELQYAGWEFAESVDRHHEHMEDRWRIEMRHPGLGVSGMSVRNNRIYMQQRMDHYMRTGNHGPPVHLIVELGMPYMVQDREPMHMYPVDTTPYMVTMAHPSDLFYQPYFRPMGDGKDIFLQKATVEEIMQLALDKQAPNQAEIRARRLEQQRRNEYHAMQQDGELAARLLMVA